MIKSAVDRGLISKGSFVIEPTSGNMGISLSMLSGVFGYRAVIVMPESVSVERRKLISAYGGEVVLTDGERGMSAAIERAEELLSETKGASTLSQFENPLNLTAHYEGMGREIYSDLAGDVDIIVAGVGTGGTIGGAGRYLKEKKPTVKIVAVEPRESAVLSGGVASSHGIQGIGAGFIPPILDLKLIDRVMTVSTDEAYEMCRVLAGGEGIFVGISSGAVLSAGISLATEKENEGKSIALVFPDGGEKYLSLYGTK
jgi:cysteine synthase A